MSIRVVIPPSEVDRHTSTSTASMLLQIMDEGQDIASGQTGRVALEERALPRSSQVRTACNQLAGVVPAVLINFLDGIGDVFEGAAAAAEGAAAAVDAQAAGFEVEGCFLDIDGHGGDGGCCEEQGGEDGGELHDCGCGLLEVAEMLVL